MMLVLLPGLLRNLPQPTLAAVVFASSLSLADVRATVRLRRQRAADFGVSIAAFLGVVLFGVLPGIAIAVALSIGDVFRRSWRPYHALLGRAEGVAGYHDLRSYPGAKLLPGLVILRFDAPLFFANARAFRDQILGHASREPRPLWIVVAAEPITDVDTTAADILLDLDERLEAAGVRLVIAELKDPVRRRLDHYHLGHEIEPARFFPTLEEAVQAFRAETGARWEPRSGDQRPADGRRGGTRPLVAKALPAARTTASRRSSRPGEPGRP
jgi:MFS superfamily sulfate permease-like transporter